jgi:hypothetical protein
MSEQQVHDAVARLGVGSNVSVRISTMASGALQYSSVYGRVASVSASSFDLSVRKGHDDAVQTLAYKDVDELHPGGGTNRGLLIVVVAIGAAAITLVAVLLQVRTRNGGG